MYTIAIAGLHHETNTFAPLPALFENFETGEGWPGLTRGAAILDVFPPINSAIGGFIKEAQERGHELLPICWAAAVPSGRVSRDAYERLAGIIVQEIAAKVDSIDAVYLDLHGAMVCEHLDDGEGELLGRIRALVGPQIPLVASLDLHANVTEAMVQHASALIGYRTYPHVDMAETGARAAHHVDHLLHGFRGIQAKAYRRLPFILPLTAQCTLVEPSRSIFETFAASEGETEGVSTCSFLPGFPAADIADCGPSLVVYADTQGFADEAGDALLEMILRREQEFGSELLEPTAAVARALSAPPGKPMILADVQDNPGAGATSDTTGLLAALAAAGAEGAVIGGLLDPEAAAAAHAAGEGAVVELALGGKLFLDGDPPFRARFTVERLSDGRFFCTGPFYGGNHADLGPCALLRLNGVRVVVTSLRMQAADQELFRHLGVEPAEQRILGLKSSVHFRGHFSDIAQDILLVEAAGAFRDRPEKLPYQRLRAGVRLGPGGPVHQGREPALS